MSGLLILCATEFEMSGFLSGIPDLDRRDFGAGGLCCTPKAGADDWACLVTGPGVFNMAMGLAAYLEHHTPAMILHTGISGAFEKAGLKTGDIALAIREQYLHTGVGHWGSDPSPLPFDLIPGDAGTRQGIYRFDPDLVRNTALRLETHFAPEKGAVFTGPFLTVSAITRGTDQAGRIHDRLAPVMESMEGAAAAHVAQSYGVPMVETRAASNLAGERDKALWDFDLAISQVAEICTALLH
ncbi:MAG: futalosine hydrolase [Desulfobacter sp.]